MQDDRFSSLQSRATLRCSFFFFFNDTATTEIYTLPLHDALPICCGGEIGFELAGVEVGPAGWIRRQRRQEEEVRVAAVVGPIHDKRRRARPRRRLQGLLVTTRGEQKNGEARQGDGLHGRGPRIPATQGASARETRCSAAGETFADATNLPRGTDAR